LEIDQYPVSHMQSDRIHVAESHSNWGGAIPEIN